MSDLDHCFRSDFQCFDGNGPGVFMKAEAYAVARLFLVFHNSLFAAAVYIPEEPVVLLGKRFIKEEKADEDCGIKEKKTEKSVVSEDFDNAFPKADGYCFWFFPNQLA